MSENLLPFIVKSLISLIPVILFFSYYYRNFVFVRSLVWLSRGILIGILSSTVAIAIQLLLPGSSSPLLKAFLHAALVEESVRYTIIAIRIKRSDENFTVLEGVFDSILIGLGFAFAENLHYAQAYPGYAVSLLRSISSVPMHAFASGIMGYFLAYRHLCGQRERRFNFTGRRRWFLAATAFLLPFGFHGLFDYYLFRGGEWNYLVPPVLLVGFGTLEYLIARARFIPGKNILGMIGIDADDMEVLDRQKDYEKWIDSAQDEDPEPLTLFKNEWSLFTTLTSFLLLLPGTVMLALFFFAPGYFPGGRGIEPETMLALIALMPLALGTILILTEKINYLYLREYMIRLPGGGKVSVIRDGAEEPFLVLDILPWGVFLSDAEEFETEEKLTAEFYRSNGEAIRMSCRVAWTNRTDRKLPVGAILRFIKPGPGFTLFRWIYVFNKLKHRLSYNLKRKWRGSS